ncbi:hypothetical protein [Streptomyces sp. NRRL S-87]|uniref:hypothetical protein n=1 Tax=Streptomyces sp. NRRL S-87 TaxID=1463920 RepID=UPI0004C24704|nr:hypothetical protein [Streptomyces sp. NRRL S-87]
MSTPVAPAPEPPESESRLGPIGRARASVAAIETLLRLREDQTDPTEDELSTLRQWPGWGPLAPALSPNREGTWAEIGEQLQRLLSPREYRHAEQGTPTAYYTPDRITQACWSALQGLGFNGGRVLEPGCGAGTFIKHTPDGLNVDWFGVERDPTTAGIAALLHPGAEIINARLQDASLQSNSVDAVLGNVPYGNYQVFDKTAPKAVTGSIHNYFIWRSVQALRPGGVAILLTSRYTMDASDDSARRAIAKHADLLGAVRLPNGALAEGGTGVLADILVVRRRDADESIDESWMGTSGVPGVSDQECNDYFLANPSHVLGAWESGRAAQYGHTLAVKAPEDQDLPAVLGEAFADITAKARSAGREWKVSSGAQAWTLDTLPFPVRDDGRKEGSFHLVEGKPHEVIEGELVAVARAGKELPKLIRLRDATLALIEAETDHDTSDEQLEPLRAEVNRLYDAYARVHGPINRYTIAQGEVDEETGEAAVSRRYPRLGGFRRDPDFVAVLALEDFDDETQTASKAALQTRRVNKRIERPTSADNPEEALSLCLNFRNQVDVPYIAQLLSIEPDQVAGALGDLVFAEPDTGDLLTVGEYLSGPVVDKLERVEFLLTQGREDLQRHAEALREVQPEPLQPEDIKAKLGAPWIPVEDVTAFAEELLGVDVDITHVVKTATWNVDTPMTIPESATSEWGTNRVDAFELLDLALNGQSPKVYDTFRTPEGGSKRVRNDKATLLAETKLSDLNRRFASWVWEDPERSDRLAADYNRRFNSTVLRKNDGSHLTVDGLDPGFNPYAHQWDFVQRVLSADEGSLCPYPVGAGKTATMFMTALKLKQLGLVNKPMVVVPNHLLEQIARDGKKLFPNANILMAGKKDLADARSRMLFAARCATGDWDTIVMTHSSFGRLGVHPVTEATYLEELANDYREALGAIDGDDANQRRIKEIAKQVDRFDARASDLRSKAVDAGVTYENLGVDFLQVDEAHLFKNLALPATTEGMSLGKPSKRATDLDLKILVTRERTGRDNVVALYSGTFISNSVREMYVFKHYTMPMRMESLGLGTPDAWAANHINFETRPEVGVDGVSFRLKRRPVDYVNADEAIALFNEVAELRPREDFKIERPEREERFVEIEATPNLVRYVEGISARIDDIQGGNVKPWEDNMLNVITDGRKAALDLELVGMDPDGPGKVGAVVRNVLEIHNQTKNLKFPDDPQDVEGALQLLFCDLGTPSKERGSQVYGKIRKGLVAGLPDEGLPGIPRERIRFIHDYNSDLAKEQLFTDARAGKVNVLFMSSQKGGTGVNVQPRGVALHHVDPPHRPDEWEQREGRLDRPGNKMIKLGKPVQFLRYLALNSFDSYMFQQLERKQRPIVQILSGRRVGRVIEEIDAVGAGFGAAKAIVAGNPLLMELADVNGQLQVLLNAADGHRQAQRRMHSKVEILDQEIGQAERSLAPMQAMADAVTAAAADDTWRTADGRLVQPDDVPAALAQSAQGARSTLDLDAGYTWRGLNVGFTWHRKQQFGNVAYESYAHLVVPGQHQVDVRLNLPWFGKGQTWRITKALGEAADAAVTAPDELRGKVAKMRTALEDTRPHLGRPFDKHAELEEVRARRATLEAQISDAAVTSGRESQSGPPFDPGAAGAEMTEADVAMHDAAVMVGMMGGSAIVRSEGQIVGTVRRAPGPAPAEEPPRPHLENPDRFFEALKAVTDAGLAEPDVIAWAQSNAADSAFFGAFGEWTRAWVQRYATDARDRPEWVYAYLDDRAYDSRDVLHGQAAAAVRQQARASADPALDPAQAATAADAQQQAQPAPEMVKIATILRYYEPLFQRHGLTGTASAADYVTRPGYGYEPDPDNPLHDLAARISGAADRGRGHFRTGPNESVTYQVGQARREAGDLLGDISISLVNLLTDTGEGYGAVDLDAILAAPPGTVVDLPPLSSTPPAPRPAPEAGTGAAPAAPAPAPEDAPATEPDLVRQPDPAPQTAAAGARRLTDPQLWDEGLRALLTGASGVERLEQAARANDSSNFAIAFADWAEDWLMDQYSDPTADWPEWARRYFGASEEAYQDRERLHAAASTALYDQLRIDADTPAPFPASPAAGKTPAPDPKPLQSLIDGFGDRVMVGHIGGPQAARIHQSAGWAIRAVLSEEQVLGLVSAVAVDGQPPSVASDTVPTERVREWIVEQQQAPVAAYYADTSSSLPPALQGNGEVQVSTNATGLTIAQRDVSTTILWEELPAWIDTAVAHDTATRSPSLPAWSYGRLDHEIHFRRGTETDARTLALDALYVALRESPPPSDEQLAVSRDRYGPPPAPDAQATGTEPTQPDALARESGPDPEPLPAEPVPGVEGYTYLETGRTVALYDSTGGQVATAKWSYTKYQYLGDVQGDTVRGTDDAAVVAQRMANHHAVVYGRDVHRPALDDQGRDPVWILHNGDDTLVYGISPEDKTAKAALWTGGGFKQSRRVGGYYLPRAWKEPTRKGRVDTAVRVLAAAGRTVVVYARRDERQQPTQALPRLPVLDVTPPNLDQLPTFFDVPPYADDADISRGVDRLTEAYGQWSELPAVQAYIQQDFDARPDGFGTLENPIAELRVAYARAEGALRGDALGGADEILRRIHAVAAWSQALEPAVDADLLAPLQELYEAAHLLSARTQATMSEFARQAQQPEPEPEPVAVADGSVPEPGWRPTPADFDEQPETKQKDVGRSGSPAAATSAPKAPPTDGETASGVKATEPSAAQEREDGPPTESVLVRELQQDAAPAQAAASESVAPLPGLELLPPPLDVRALELADTMLPDAAETLPRGTLIAGGGEPPGPEATPAERLPYERRFNLRYEVGQYADYRGEDGELVTARVVRESSNPVLRTDAGVEFWASESFRQARFMAVRGDDGAPLPAPAWTASLPDGYRVVAPVEVRPGDVIHDYRMNGELWVSRLVVEVVESEGRTRLHTVGLGDVSGIWVHYDHRLEAVLDETEESRQLAEAALVSREVRNYAKVFEFSLAEVRVRPAPEPAQGQMDLFPRGTEREATEGVQPLPPGNLPEDDARPGADRARHQGGPGTDAFPGDAVTNVAAPSASQAPDEGSESHREGLPGLVVVPPPLDVPALGPAQPFTDDADLQADAGQLHEVYRRWIQLPGVRRYLDDDQARRGESRVPATNPIAALDEAYTRARAALEAAADIGGPDVVLARLYAVAAWSRALAPAVGAELADPLGELHAAAQELAARSQATIEAFAAEESPVEPSAAALVAVPGSMPGEPSAVNLSGVGAADHEGEVLDGVDAGDPESQASQPEIAFRSQATPASLAEEKTAPESDSAEQSTSAGSTEAKTEHAEQSPAPPADGEVLKVSTTAEPPTAESAAAAADNGASPPTPQTGAGAAQQGLAQHAPAPGADQASPTDVPQVEPAPAPAPRAAAPVVEAAPAETPVQTALEEAQMATPDDQTESGPSAAAEAGGAADTGIEDPPPPLPYTEVVPLLTDDRYELHLFGRDGQGPERGELHVGGALVARVTPTADSRWIARLAVEGAVADEARPADTPQEAASSGALLYAVLHQVPYGEAVHAAEATGTLARADVLRTDLRDAALQHLALITAAAEEAGEAERNLPQLRAWLEVLAEAPAENHDSQQMDVHLSGVLTVVNRWGGALPAEATEERRLLAFPLAQLRYDITRLQERLQATLEAARADAEAVPGRSGATDQESPTQQQTAGHDEPARSQRFTTSFPLTYDQHRLHLEGTDGQADQGEVRREGASIATLQRTADGRWYARMQLATPDVTTLVDTPETAAENAAVMWAVVTGSPLGEPVVAAPGSDLQDRAEQVRSELRTFAAQHALSIETAARQLSPNYASNRHYAELTTRLADVADAAGRGARMMAADLHALEQAATTWNGTLPPSSGSATRATLVFPLAHVLFDVRRLQERLRATVDAAQQEAAAAAELSPPASDIARDDVPTAQAAEPSEPDAAEAGDAIMGEPELPAAEEPTAPADQAPEATPADDSNAAFRPAEGESDPTDDVTAGLTGEPAPAAPDVPELATPREDPQSARHTSEEAEGAEHAPLWGTDELPVSVYAAKEEGQEERPDPESARESDPDLHDSFQEFLAAWDDTVANGGTGGTSADLHDEVREDLVTLQGLIAEAASDVPAADADASPAAPEPTPERDEHQAAAAVNESLREADTLSNLLQDLPEWQKIQTVRGAMGHLLTVVKRRAGEQFDRLLGDERASGFLRELSAKACDRIAGLAQAAARRLRGDGARADERGGALPSAEALLRLGDAATAYTAPRPGSRRTPPAGRVVDQLDIGALRKMGEALAKPMPGGRPKVSAAAARGRSTTAKRPVKKPAPGSTEQAGHLRRGPEQPQPRKPQQR